MTDTIPTYNLHEDLDRLMDHRGLLRRVAEESGAKYKRIHELVKTRSEPRHSLGKNLDDWISCASLLAATRADLINGLEIPFARLMRLLELKDRVSTPFLRIKIDGVIELLGPVARVVNPSAEEFKLEMAREQSHQIQAKHLIDKSISALLEEIEQLLK